jgi:death-on-curing protein
MDQYWKNYPNLDDRTIVLITVAGAMRFHDIAITRYGGLPGIRDFGLLESAVHQPLMILEFGSSEERTVPYLAAAYSFHIIKNHPFLDGNKRTGVITAAVFLAQNGFSLEISYDELYQLAIDTATSKVHTSHIAAIIQRSIQVTLH